MLTQAIVAEQTSRNRYHRPAPLPPREIELTVRLDIPEGTGANVGIVSSLDPPLPSRWADTLHQRLYLGVHGGLASAGAPLPEDGIGIRIAEPRLLPDLDAESDPVDVQRLGDLLEALTEATVTGLWAGVVSLGASAAP
jgi:hypothetical protein